jgi:integrase
LASLHPSFGSFQPRNLAPRTFANHWQVCQVAAGNTGLRGGEIKKLRIGNLDLERRRLVIRRADTKSDAGARIVELNRDATEAATRLLMPARTLKPPASRPEHYLMPKHLSRIAHGEHKGERGYDPNQH